MTLTISRKSKEIDQKPDFSKNVTKDKERKQEMKKYAATII